MLKQIIRNALGVAGLGIVRLRDPYVEIARLLGATSVRTIIDGGAFHGTTVRHAHAIFPEAVIHAFEPQRESFEALTRNAGTLDRVRLHAAALSDFDGEQTFFVDAVPYMSSLLAGHSTALHQVEQRKVAVRTIDAVIAEEHAAPVDAMKLDLQGHELAALRGAERALTTCRAVLVEVNFRRRYEGACSFEELTGFLGARDFGLYRLYDINQAADTGWAHADALFVRPPLAA